jgi:hypothetical protein
MSLNYDREALRALTLADNFAWLRSFGCTVEERQGMTFVNHPSLDVYEAWLFTRASGKAVRQLRRVVTGDTAGAHTVYVDDDAAIPEVRAILGRARKTGRNVTAAVRVPIRAWRSPTLLQPATLNEWHEWAAMYSLGFGREAYMDVDRQRWRLAFSSKRVQHWFFVQDGVRAGVCQTTTGPVHGIYSFTLLPEVRGVRSALNALRALLAFVAPQPSPWLYFEVLNKSLIARTRLQSAIGLINVRNLTGYEVSAVGAA